MVIPLNCLVFASSVQLDLFPSHERLSQHRITYDLVGADRRDLQEIVFVELRHRLGLKLSLGQRVVVLDDLSGVHKQQLTVFASNQGVQVIDLTKQVDAIQLAQILPANSYAYLRSHWKGLTIIGDIHGDLQALTTALTWARTRQHFVWLLGDVIDYGAETLATADAVYREVMAGNAALILGNHERKIASWVDQRESGKSHLRVNDGNRVTIEALESLQPYIRKQWIGRFRSLLGHAALMQQIGNVTLLHAAAHPTLWGDKPNHRAIEQFALYGEGDHYDGKFRRVHHWVNAVPMGQLVIVGHDVISKFPIVATGAKGGQVVFLDTGCGTGSQLSTPDLRFDDTGLHLECFNRH